MQNFTLKIVKILKPVPDVITIGFKQPGLKKVKYKPGQYLTLIVRINERKYIRPYSMSSAPGVDPFIEITIKRIPNGIVSNYLYDHAKVDDVIEVMEPMGDFVYDPVSGNNHLVLWGAGSGVTPLFSIIKSALIHNPLCNISLFYCNRNPNHVIFGEEIKTLQEKYKDKFIVWHFFTGIPEDVYLNYQLSGRISEQKILSIITDTSQLSQSVHYICGPQGLKDTIKGVLQNVNTPQHNIFSEEFEVLIDPEQFDDIESQVIQIGFNGAAQSVEVIKGKSILDAGLDTGLDLPYSCQTGTCTLCKAKLKSGNVKIIGVEKVPDELAVDEILMCCSYPYTNNIKIQVN